MNTAHLVAALLKWYGRHARDLPWRRTRDPYAIWVSEVMLQQTQVQTVIPYWERWMAALPDIAAVARAKPEKLHKLWEGLGYYTRVRNLQKAAQRILEEHGGRFPRQVEQVLALPGIGRYTAGAICSIAFNQPTPVLDGNVIRVLARLFAIEGSPRDPKTNARLWELAGVLVQTAAGRSVVPPGAAPTAPGKMDSSGSPCSRLNQALMELGAMVCTPRQPACGACPVAVHCEAVRLGKVDLLPRLGARPRSTRRRFVAFVVQNGGRFLVRQRPARVVNAELWEFPNVEVGLREGDLSRAARQALGFKASGFRPFCAIRHTITRYRITLEVVTARSEPPRAARGRWLTRAQMRRLPFTSAHRKILKKLGSDLNGS